MSEKPKLEVLRMIVDKDCKGRNAEIDSKEVRRMVTKLRGGTHSCALKPEDGKGKVEKRENVKNAVGKKWRMQSTSF